MMISDGAIKVKCHNCGIKRPEAEWSLQTTYRWKNANGCCIRIFCRACGHVYDVEQLYKNGEAIEKRHIAVYDVVRDVPL